ncbi:MAG TPA: transporter substrate-binding domain-containing protein [Opitutaceae bacterium]|nr:transporter substrate-binding domain-containing protein [Opitutaceae bacterium]
MARIKRRSGKPLLAIAAVLLAGRAAATPVEGALRDLSRPIIVATSDVYYPYQFRDSDGQLKGFADDVTDAVARAMNLPLRRVVVANSAMADSLRTGRVDVIQFWGETEARHAWADFSVPIARFETVAVVRTNDRRIRTLADLAGKRVAVGQPGTVGYNYLVAEQPRAIPVYSDTTEAFLREVSTGRIDAAVMSRLTAASMIDRFHLDNLQVLGDRIKGDAYDVRYCFTVRKGDSLLLARLNEGLAIINRTGEFDRIYRRWFGRYEKRTFSPFEVVSYVAAALALACAAITWMFVRQRTLSRRVARQAAELAEQRSLLAALYDKHPLATVIVEVTRDGEVVLVSVNAEAVRLFRLDPAVPVGRELRDLPVPDEFRGCIGDAVRRWREPAGPRNWEAKLAGGQVLVEAAWVPLGETETGGHRLCVLAGDVTRRRLVEHELAQSRRLRALGELVGGIAHEFNNLLTPILVTTSQARTQRVVPSSPQAEFAVIENAARRAAELTKRLLTFGRKHDERPSAVQLSEAVENCFALLRSTVDRRVEWALRVAPGLAPLQANPTDLNQIVFNLVINARDTLLEKLQQQHDGAWTPRLTVWIEELPGESRTSNQALRIARAPSAAGGGAGREPLGWQKLTVEDNGLGIAPEVIDRVFEPFFTTKDTGQGTGLGLATVWHLVTELGGDVAIESRPGEGTRFIVMLPRWPLDVAQPRVASGQPAAATAAKRLSILLAEDDPLVTRAALAVLERAAHVVTHCADGADAWSRLADDPSRFDLLLLDLNMPRLNGIDLIRRVRSGVFGGAIAVMSGRISDEERRCLAGLRVDRIITKPFGAGDLIEAVRGVSNARRAPAG